MASKRRRILVTSMSRLDLDPRVRRAVEAFLDAGYRVEALVLDRPADRHPRLKTWRIPIVHRRGGPLRYLFEYLTYGLGAMGWTILRMLRGRPHAVYVNSPPDAFVFAAWFAKAMRVPLILDVHDPMPELFEAKGGGSRLVGAALRLQERWSLRFADRVVTVHEPLRRLLASRSPDVPIEVVMNVPDLSTIPARRSQTNGRTLVFTGTVAVRYGVDDVVHALHLLADAVPGIVFRVIGDGEDLDAIVRLAERLGVGDRLDLVGRVPYARVHEHQRDAWAGVNVPKPDRLGALSFSNKVVEWVAMGLPVVAARTETMVEYFPEGTLWYVEPGSPESIAEALVGLHEATPEEVQRRVGAAREALARIEWPNQRRRLLAVVSGDDELGEESPHQLPDTGLAADDEDAMR